MSTRTFERIDFALDNMGDGIDGDQAAMQALCVKVATRVLRQYADTVPWTVGHGSSHEESESERELSEAVWSACCEGSDDEDAYQRADAAWTPGPEVFQCDYVGCPGAGSVFMRDGVVLRGFAREDLETDINVCCEEHRRDTGDA